MKELTTLLLILKIIGALIVGIGASFLAALLSALGDKPPNATWLDHAMLFLIFFSLGGLYIGFHFPRRWYVTALIGLTNPLYMPVPLVAGYIGSLTHAGLLAIRNSWFKYPAYALEFFIGFAPPLLLVYWLFFRETSQGMGYLGIG